MRKSFYSWLMTERNPKSKEPKAILADLAFQDTAFPKHTDDFDEVSRFLEEHANFPLTWVSLMLFGKSIRPIKWIVARDSHFLLALI